MPEPSTRQRIWLVDRREHWRDLFSRALAKEGFTVRSTGNYLYPLSGGRPDLVVLACTAITPAESKLIKTITARRHRLLVVATTLPIDTMREVFLAGAYDATVMPVRAGDFVHLVQETLEHSASAANPQALLIAGM